MGFDFHYYLEYLDLAWTDPGEKPVFIQIMSILLTSIFISIAFSIRRKNQYIQTQSKEKPESGNIIR